MSARMSFSMILSHLNKKIQGERLEIEKQYKSRRSLSDRLGVKKRAGDLLNLEEQTRSAPSTPKNGSPRQEDMNVTNDVYLKRLNSLKERILLQQRRYNAMSLQISETQRCLAEVSDKSARLTNDLKNLKSKYDKSEAKCVLLETKVNKLQTKNEQLLVDLKEANRDRDRLGKSRKTIQQQDQRLINVLNKQLSNLREQIDSKEQEIARLRLSQFINESSKQSDADESKQELAQDDSLCCSESSLCIVYPDLNDCNQGSGGAGNKC